MLDIVSLMSIALAFFVIAVSPGPANISNATIAMSRGRKASLIYGVGLSFGLVFWGVIAISGLGIVLQHSLYLMMLLKLLGGSYLIWLAYLSAKAARHPQPTSLAIKNTSAGYSVLLMKGILLNISNPKTVIAWMAALSVGMNASSTSASLLAGFGVCIAVGFATNAMYSLLFSVKGMMQGYQRGKRWVDGLVSGLFAFAGAGLIRSAFDR